MTAVTSEKQRFPSWAIALAALGGIGLAAIGYFAVAFQPFTNPSEAMAPGVPEGSYMIAARTRAVERGDIVVFRLPRDGRTVYVKRLIGLPGDRVRFVSGMLELNGRPVDQKAVRRETAYGTEVMRVRETLPTGAGYDIYDRGPDHDGDTTDTYVIPTGHFFFVGDNRDNSLDSRWSGQYGVGFVPRANIIGKIVWMVKAPIR
jgi:signal peptidase I